MAITQIRLDTQTQDATLTPAKISTTVTDDFSFPRDVTATRNMKVGDGSAGLPTLTFVSDTNTGIFHQAADSIGIAAGGTEYVRVGTTYTQAFNAILSKSGGSATAPDIAVGSATTGLFNSTGGSDFHIAVGGSDKLSHNGVQWEAFSPFRFTAGSAAVASISLGSDPTTGIFHPSAGIIAITNSGTESARVDSTGIKTINGAAGSPSFSFTGDSNTGLYDIAADTLGIVTGGLEAVRFTSAQDANFSQNVRLVNGKKVILGNSDNSWIEYDSVNTVLTVSSSTPLNLTATSVNISSLVLTPNGTSSAPTYSFTNDSAAGLYLATPGVLGIAASTWVSVSATALLAPAGTGSAPGLTAGGDTTTGLTFGTFAGRGSTVSVVAAGSTAIELSAGGVFTISNGTALAPAYSFANNLGSGLYLANDDAGGANAVLALAAGGSAVITLGPTSINVQGSRTLSLNSNKITSVADPTLAQDAATKNYVDTHSASNVLTSAHILVGNGLNVATDVAMSGDVHIDNTGSTTIQPAVVTGSKIASATITNTNVASGTFAAITGVGIQSQSLDMGTHTIQNVADPVNAQDAATKAYVDSAAAGLDPKASSRVATATTLTLTTDYTRAGSGGTHTLTHTSNGVLSIDGVSTGWVDITNDGASRDPMAANPASRVLVKDASDPIDNGIYAVQNQGSLYAHYTGTPAGASTPVTITANNAGTVGNAVSLSFDGVTTISGEIANWNSANPSNMVTLTSGNGGQTPNNGVIVALAGGTDAAWVLIRATDQDGTPTNEVSGGNFTFVEQGTANASTGWTVQWTGNVIVDTNPINWIQFSAAGAVIAGAGMTQSGATLNVVSGDASLTVNADELHVHRDIAGAIGLSGAGIAVNTDGSTLEINTNALRIKDAGVTYAKTNIVTRETPTGAVDGVNTTFTLANSAAAGSEHVFLNGILQDVGVSNDYTISGATITFNFAPASGSKIRVTYWKA